MIRSTFLPPMPNPDQLEKMFNEILIQMDLPVDKMRILRGYGDLKKWKMINDRQQQLTEQVTPPSKYLENLSYFMDKKLLRKSIKKRKIQKTESSTRVLRHIEISLRTNSVDWVFEFLEWPNNGLQKLVDYMEHLLADCATETPTTNELQTSLPSGNYSVYESFSNYSLSETSANYSSIISSTTDATSSSLKKGPLTMSTRKVVKTMREDDIHICMMCLRAIMNNRDGFQQVFFDKEAIYCIVRTILHQNLRTKTLVMQILTSICMVKGGQEIVSSAFDRFEKDFREPRRFWTVMEFVRNSPEFNVDFLVSVIEFFDNFVNSVDNMNLRVHRQYELKNLGLDEYIERMSNCQSEELQEIMLIYLSNTIDVSQLMEDSLTRSSLLEELKLLKRKLSQANERVQEVEAKWITDKAALDGRLLNLIDEKNQLEKECLNWRGTYTKTMLENDGQLVVEKNLLEQRIAELENVQKTMQAGLQVRPRQSSSLPTSSPTLGKHREYSESSTTPTELSVISLSGAPLLPPISSIPPPPPIAGLISPKGSTVPISPPPPATIVSAGSILPPPPPPPLKKFTKTIETTKNYLPTLIWSALDANQAKNTVFEKLNNESILKKLNFSKLEEMFKLIPDGLLDLKKDGNLIGQLKHGLTGRLGTSESKSTVLTPNRLRVVGISSKKIALNGKSIMAAVHQLDLQLLSAEKLDILSRILPTDEERKKYEKARGKFDEFTEEDVLLASLCEIERLEHKLKIMRVMANFDETIAFLHPQLTLLTAASKSTQESRAFHGILEVILAFGNFMNNGKRKEAYGFKISSLDSLAVLKSPFDQSLTLLHIIVASVEQSFPDLSGFAQQLKFMEKATKLRWDVISADMTELQAGFELARSERQLKGNDYPDSLVSFLDLHQTKMEELKKSYQLAEKTFTDCVKFYGENAKSMPPDVFFQKLSEFVNNYAKCRQENEARTTLEKRQCEEHGKRAEFLSKPTNQQKLMSESAEKVRGGGPRKHQAKIDSNRMNHGDFEKLMKRLKQSGESTSTKVSNVRKMSKSPSSAPRKSVEPSPSIAPEKSE